MKFLFVFLFIATLASSQTSKPAASDHPRRTTTQAAVNPQGQQADMNALWQAELPNMKSDLAELRSMLNVMASQESSLDLRSSGAFQTNRKMWQILIARLSELTQRMDALERSQGHQLPGSHPEQP